MQVPVSAEVAGALSQFVYSGKGPRHSKLTSVFHRTGFGDVAYYDAEAGVPNKEFRVQTAIEAAVRRPAKARALVDALLVELRLHGCFDPADPAYDAISISKARVAFGHEGFDLSDDGHLIVRGMIDLTTGGRTALDDQLRRLRRGTEDAALLLGAAKDLLESTAKHVLEETGMGVPKQAQSDFGYLWHLARDRLQTLPVQVAPGGPGAEQVRKILGASWVIAEQVNALRNDQGTGHGRTLPTGVSEEMALLVVREACSVAEFTLATLDRVLAV